jgi:GMP synthase (glutamine-hydrolysing)
MSNGSQIAILEFGSQHTLEIARCLRELGYRSEIIKPEEFDARRHHVVIGSGGFGSVYDSDTPTLSPFLLPTHGDRSTPYLGICYGMQISVQQSGGLVARGEPEYAKTFVDVNPSPLFEGLSSPRQTVWMSHGDRVVNLPQDFEILAMSESGAIAAVGHKKMPHFGVQFHPEVSHTPEGKIILKNFIQRVVGLLPDYTAEDLEKVVAERIRREVGDNHALLLYSGGVDSSVVGRIAAEVLGDRLHAVTYDGGHLREGEVEEIKRNATVCGINLRIVNCMDHLLQLIGKTTDPEEKRSAFRAGYGWLTRREAARANIRYVIQGTIAPDRIESGKTGGAKIKTHHNSAGLDFGDLQEVHPIEDLYKDEVRALAKQLGLPLHIFNRRPFPGPGNFLRVVGLPVDRGNLAVVGWAEARVRELADADLRYQNVAQIVVAVLGKSVGVKGDKRVFGYTIGVRGVLTKDFMTAEGVAFEPDFQKLVAKKLGEHPKIVQVGFFPIDKPPGTTEFE